MFVKRFKVLLQAQPEGGWTVLVPSLPGCVSQGETEQEALENIVDAIRLYLESIRERNLAVLDVKEAEVEVETGT